MYKAIFIDIDGTLVNDNGNISERTIEAIKKVTEKGILVIICTGRPIKHTVGISKACKASNYIITSNGGGIYDYEKNEVLYTNKMDKKAIIELYKIAEKVNARFIMDSIENRVVNKLKNLDGSEIQLKISIEEFVNKNDIIQCVISDTDFDKMKSIKEQIEKVENVEIKNQHKNLIDETAPRKGSAYYDVASIESNKGNAIKEFCKIKNIDLKDVVAIGDSINDISMFEVVGHSVAMGNASDKVKEYADEITESNENDGVAVFLEKLLKKYKKNSV